ncbi:MAG: DCC1-like thiol-disulfide oxidoreductase family protein [Pseudomonadota bacterium]
MLPPTYVYDGECVLCSRAVQYVLKHDRSDPPIRFVAIKSAEGREIAARAGVDPDDPHTFIFVEGGKISLLSEAVFAMAARAGGPGRFIRVFRFVPRPLRDWVYARIANNRYALFGKLERCYLPPENTQDRFVLE